MDSRPVSLRCLLAVTLMLASLGARAGSSEIRRQGEASVLLTGIVEVAPDGALRDYRLDQPGKIDVTVREFLDGNIHRWKFAVDSLPVGTPANAIVVDTMSLLVVARPLDNDQYQLRLAAVNFEPKEPVPGTQVAYKSLKKPDYPKSAAAAGAQGTVYLLLKVGADGSFQDGIAEQTNLRGVASNESEMERWRKVLATTALAAARRWTFVIPSPVGKAPSPWLVVRAPVDFSLSRKKVPYGQWVAYIPGPRLPNPWQAVANPGFAPDALPADGRLYSSNGVRLSTPLQQAPGS